MTSTDLTQKIYEQFNYLPYPESDIKESTKDNLELLFIHSIITPYYLRYQQTITTEDKIILDAGCGSGWKSLSLALANPGAKIVGIDISEKSVELARQRLEFHNIKNAEFHVLSIYEVEKLGLQFDYINCDEVLYLFDEPGVILSKFNSILKPRGIIRSNLHSYYQRFSLFRAQKLFTLMGLLEDNPEDMEVDIALETMKALHDGVNLKQTTWNKTYEGEKSKQAVLMNYLFQGDKGYIIADLFRFLEEAKLDFLSMTNWRHWEVLDLFKDKDNLPFAWAMGLAEASIEDRLTFYELLHPIHRLLDFWCVKKNEQEQPIPVSNWSKDEWLKSFVSLHPLLKREKVKEDLLKCLQEYKPFEISRYIKLPTTQPFLVETSLAACLLPLWEDSQPLAKIVAQWLKIQPLQLDTLEPKDEKIAFKEVIELLTKLELFLYVLVEQIS